jgi:2,7-dihydroxy-5-methyl-1-naphthoate 7-O-methyltransferase
VSSVASRSGKGRSRSLSVSADADSRARLRELSDLATPWAIHVAATLRLADHVAAGARTDDELARAAGADAGTLGRLLRLLVAQGVFDEPRPGEVELNDVSRLLLDEVGWRPWLDLDGAPGIWNEAWTRLLRAVRTGSPGEGEQDFQERLAADPGRWDSFDELMAAHVESTAAALASAYDWSGVAHVVDVGGGTGTLLRELLQAHHDLRGTLLELPEVAAKARASFADAGLAGRCDVVEGSYFDVMPAGDVYCLSQILHGFPDEPAAQLLRRCAEAGGPDVRVLVLEQILDPADAASTGFDLFMLTLGGGRQRTADQFRALAERTGLELRSATRLESETDLLVLG